MKQTFVEFFRVGEPDGAPKVQIGFLTETGAPAIAVTGDDDVTRLAELPWKDVHLEPTGVTIFRKPEEGVGAPACKWHTFDVCDDKPEEKPSA